MKRKNLVIDETKLADLAHRKRVSESQAAREAIEDALFAEEVMEIVRRVHQRGPFPDPAKRDPEVD